MISIYFSTAAQNRFKKAPQVNFLPHSGPNQTHYRDLPICLQTKLCFITAVLGHRQRGFQVIFQTSRKNLVERWIDAI